MAIKNEKTLPMTRNKKKAIFLKKIVFYTPINGEK